MTCSLKDLRKKQWGLKNFVREQESSQAAQCHQQLPPALPPQVSWMFLHIPTQKLRGLCTLSLLCCCANLCEQSLRTVQGLQTAQPISAQPSKQVSVHSSPQNSCWRLLLPEMSALAVPGTKSFSQEKNPKGQSPALLSGGGKEMPYGTVSGSICVSHEWLGPQRHSWNGTICPRQLSVSSLSPQNQGAGKCDHICANGSIWLPATSPREWKHFQCKWLLEVSEEQVPPNHVRRPLAKLKYSLNCVFRTAISGVYPPSATVTLNFRRDYEDNIWFIIFI